VRERFLDLGRLFVRDSGDEGLEKERKHYLATKIACDQALEPLPCRNDLCTSPGVRAASAEEGNPSIDESSTNSDVQSACYYKDMYRWPHLGTQRNIVAMVVPTLQGP
jgi:hypothetical protein